MIPDRRPADGVNGTVNPVKATSAHAPANPIVIQPDRQELLPGDVPVLASGNAGDFSVYVRVIPQTSSLEVPRP